MPQSDLQSFVRQELPEIEILEVPEISKPEEAEAEIENKCGLHNEKDAGIPDLEEKGAKQQAAIEEMRRLLSG